MLVAGAKAYSAAYLENRAAIPKTSLPYDRGSGNTPLAASRGAQLKESEEKNLVLRQENSMLRQQFDILELQLSVMQAQQDLLDQTVRDGSDASGASCCIEETLLTSFQLNHEVRRQRTGQLHRPRRRPQT